MHIDQAKLLLSALERAIAQAQAAGHTEVALQPQLQALDDQARGELAQAIAGAAAVAPRLD